VTATNRERAIAAAGKGYTVFPVHVGLMPDGSKKVAPISDWPNAGTTDLDTVLGWWSEGSPWADAVPAIDNGRSGVVTVDLDLTHGNDGPAEWERLGGRYPVPGRVVTTRSGGRHLFYRADPARPVSNQQSKIAPGVDVRGEGGFTFAWGSLPGKGELPPLPEIVYSASTPATPKHVPPSPTDQFGMPPHRFTHQQAAEQCREYLAKIENATAGVNDVFGGAARWCYRFAPAFWPKEDIDAWLLVALAEGDRRRGVAEPPGGWPWSATHQLGTAWTNSRTDWLAVVDVPFAEAPAAAPTEDAVSKLRARMFSVEQIKERPDQVAVIARVLFVDTLATIFGEYGSYKSFVALDMACCVALGRMWHGHKVRQGRVLYLAAEGADGLKKRVEGWEQHHGVEIGDDLTIIDRPVMVDGPEWAVLCEIVRQDQYSLIFLDTRARITSGLDENSNTDMGKLVDAVTALKEASDHACVVLIHHAGREGQHERGATCVPGAMDTTLMVERKGNVAVISGHKQKDSAQDKALRLPVKVIDLGRTDESGEKVTTLVLTDDVAEPATDGESGSLRNRPEEYREPLIALVTILESIAPDSNEGPGLTRADLVSLMGKTSTNRHEAAGKGWSKSWVYKAINEAVDYGWLTEGATRSQFRILGKQDRDAATDEWRDRNGRNEQFDNAV